MRKLRPYCLTIAGFDPSGGAGLVADCKAFEQIGVTGLSVQTANTVQTEDQFIATNWISDEQIAHQLTVLLERYPVRYIKIGLVRDADSLSGILKIIRTHAPLAFVLWDPVLQPSAGGNLDKQRFQESLSELLPRVSGIIPNVPEYAHLFGEIAPESLIQHIPFLYLKGGHATERGKDVLYANGKRYPFNPRIQTDLHKHGTGCVLSAALIAHLALDYPLVKACLRSKRYLEHFLVSNPTLLGYHSR